MTKTTITAITAAMLIGAGTLVMPAPAEAGRGHAVGAALIGFGIGAVVGSALAPREVYVVPPPAPPAYYAPAAYGPQSAAAGVGQPFTLAAATSQPAC